MHPNYILVTLDSCRGDTFERARLGVLKTAKWEKCWTHGTFTFPAHMAFFAGKLPHAHNGKELFDTAASGLRKKWVKPPIWRLANPESPRASRLQLEGRNIKDGFRRMGYTTIGTGAMNWFDPDKPAAQALVADFDHFRFFPNTRTGDGRNIQQQAEWVRGTVSRSKKPYFLFINVGETHHRYQAEGHGFDADWGDAQECSRAQIASLEYVDRILGQLFSDLTDYFAIICGDHGDCWGEDGLWGHGFYHPRVMEVPMAIRQATERPWLAPWFGRRQQGEHSVQSVS